MVKIMYKKIEQSGRSMVEMLGVLAIIGVLSIGALAGYSKAMMKYKLNKQAEAMNMLLNNTLQTAGRLTYDFNDSGSAIFIVDYLKKLNLIPDGMKYYSSSFITDNFNRYISVYAYPTIYAIRYYLKASPEDREICYNLVNVYKENAPQLFYVALAKNDFAENSEYIYGDNYCEAGKRCLKNLTINDIDAVCNQCVGEVKNCHLHAVWK